MATHCLAFRSRTATLDLNQPALDNLRTTHALTNLSYFILESLAGQARPADALTCARAKCKHAHASDSDRRSHMHRAARPPAIGGSVPSTPRSNKLTLL
jgi:hypothetical protein